MECDKAFDHCSLREDWCHLLPKFFQNPSESTSREFAQCCFNCVFCSVLKSQRHILKVMKWWCGDVSSKGEYEWQQSEEKQVRPFLLQPSLHSVQKPKEYPFWSLLFVETNSIGIQTKLNQWKYDIERKTSFEAWTNSPKKVNLMFLFQREGFSLNHFLLARNIGKDILPNATNRDVTMLLERDGGWGRSGRTVKLSDTYFTFAWTLVPKKVSLKKEKEHLFFSTDPTGSILVFSGLCIDV